MFGSTVEKIMRLGTKKKGAKIVPYLKSRDKQVRMAAIAALGQAGGEEAFDSLTYILSSAADQERIAAVHALGRAWQFQSDQLSDASAEKRE